MNNWKQILASIGIVIGLIFIGGFFLLKADEKTWGDGTCPNCHVEWEYREAVGHRNSTSYIYECPKCHNKIEIFTQNYLTN